MRVSIWHKTDRGNIFEPYEGGDEVDRVFTFELNHDEFDMNVPPRSVAGKIAERCFAAFNGHPPADPRWVLRSKIYHEDERLRSLSVGDVVVIGEIAYAVERFGFTQVTIPGAV